MGFRIPIRNREMVNDGSAIHARVHHGLPLGSSIYVYRIQFDVNIRLVRTVCYKR